MVGGGTRTAELDLARVPARRLLDDRAAHPRLAVLPHARPAGARRRADPARCARWPIRSMAAERSYSSARSPRLPPISTRIAAPTTALPGAGCSARWRATQTSSAAELLRPVVHVPRHPLALARFGLPALRSAAASPAAGSAAKPAQGAVRRPGGPLDARAGPAAVRLVRAGPRDLSPTPSAGRWSAAVGRPSPRRLPQSSGRLGGEIVTGHESRACASCPSRAWSSWTRRRVPPSPSPVIASRRGPGAAYERFRYGQGVFKVDWALAGPVPWTADGLRRAATVHLGGSLEEIVRSEREVAAGRPPDAPFTLFVQYHPWDPSRAPDGKTTAWAYCHVPAGSDVDMTDAHRGAGRAVRTGLPRPDPWPQHPLAGADGGPRRRTTSAETSMPGSRTSASSCSGRPCRSTRITPARACTCARHRRLPVAASMGWAATTRPDPRCGATSASRRRRPADRRRSPPRGGATSRGRGRRLMVGRSRSRG